MSGQKPVQQFRMGRVVAAIFENPGEQRVRYSVTVSRLYKTDEEGAKWQRSTSFGRDDLPMVSSVSSRAWEWIFSQQEAGADAAF